MPEVHYFAIEKKKGTCGHLHSKHDDAVLCSERLRGYGGNSITVRVEFPDGVAVNWSNALTIFVRLYPRLAIEEGWNTKPWKGRI